MTTTSSGRPEPGSSEPSPSKQLKHVTRNSRFLCYHDDADRKHTALTS